MFQDLPPLSANDCFIPRPYFIQTHRSNSLIDTQLSHNWCISRREMFSKGLIGHFIIDDIAPSPTSRVPHCQWERPVEPEGICVAVGCCKNSAKPTHFSMNFMLCPEKQWQSLEWETNHHDSVISFTLKEQTSLPWVYTVAGTIKASCIRVVFTFTQETPLFRI